MNRMLLYVRHISVTLQRFIARVSGKFSFCSRKQKISNLRNNEPQQLGLIWEKVNFCPLKYNFLYDSLVIVFW
jgi:hypothetical protein